MSKRTRQRKHKMPMDSPLGSSYNTSMSSTGSPVSKKPNSSIFSQLSEDPNFHSFISNIVSTTLASNQATPTSPCTNCQRLAEQIESHSKELALLKLDLARNSQPSFQSGYWESPKVSRTEKTATARFVDSNPQFTYNHVIASAVQNAAAFVEKQKLLVLEQLADFDKTSTKEKPNDNETALARQLCKSAGVGNDFVRAWRIPSHENSARPLKIELTNVSSRDKVLFGFRKNFAPLANSWKPGNGRRVSARRDMTRPELVCHREMRKWVYEENKKTR